jgi:Mn-containing catalase
LQSFHVGNVGVCDILQAIATEKIQSQLEMVAKRIAQQTSKVDQTTIY